jgi:hypothetical protein
MSFGEWLPPEIGHSENGRSEIGRSDIGRSEIGRSENGRSENGRFFFHFILKTGTKSKIKI